MARCDYCGTTILFGGVRNGQRRFCSEECSRKGVVFTIADQIPQDVLGNLVTEVHDGTCPKCGGPGPVDVYTSHRVWSILVTTSWASKPEVCCWWCGTKAKLGAIVFSSVLGWWGIPWGLILTPIQVFRNLGGLLLSPHPSRPSPQLENLVRANLAARFMAENQPRGKDA